MISSSSYIMILKDAIESGSVDLGTIESCEEGSGTIDGKNAKWLKAKIRDEDVCGTVYWGAIDGGNGCISVASLSLAVDMFPSFPESEYLNDVNCVTLAE